MRAPLFFTTKSSAPAAGARGSGSEAIVDESADRRGQPRERDAAENALDPHEARIHRRDREQLAQPAARMLIGRSQLRVPVLVKLMDFAMASSCSPGGRRMILTKR